MESPPNHMHTPFRDAVCQRKPPDALNLDRFETKLNKNKSKIKLFGGGGGGGGGSTSKKNENGWIKTESC